VISGAGRGGWHAGTTAWDTSNASVTSSSVPWSPPQPSSRVLLPILPVGSGAAATRFAHTHRDRGLDYAFSVLPSIQE